MVDKFDIDQDKEKNGLIGGEMTDRGTVGPCWDWHPDGVNVSLGVGGGRVLGQLDHSEFHTAREGTR